MKYFLKFKGIGEAGAAMAMAALAANPATIGLTTGFTGKVIFFIWKLIFMALASIGLVVLNVGVAKIETIVDEKNMDDSWDDADKVIAAIRATGRELTPEEELAIDTPVIDAFRKWASFARTKKKKKKDSDA